MHIHTPTRELRVMGNLFGKSMSILFLRIKFRFEIIRLSARLVLKWIGICVDLRIESEFKLFGKRKTFISLWPMPSPLQLWLKPSL